MTSKALVQAFVEAVNRQDWQAIQALVADNFTRHSAAAGEPHVASREDLILFLRAEYRTFPDAHEEIADMIAEGDRVAVRMRFRGTQAGPLGPYPATGKTVNSEYLAIYRVNRDRIAEAWAEWDSLVTLRQLGHLR